VRTTRGELRLDERKGTGSSDDGPTIWRFWLPAASIGSKRVVTAAPSGGQSRLQFGNPRNVGFKAYQLEMDRCHLLQYGQTPAPRAAKAPPPLTNVRVRDAPPFDPNAGK
jgi:hypothetical protein